MQADQFQNFVQSINYTVFQEKGQRIFRPMDPSFDDKEYDEVKQHEVFITQLPNDLYENELLPFLCRVGPVYQIRFIMNFSGTTKGIAYVIFTEVQHAFQAVEELDGQYIRPDWNKAVKINFSVNNKRLLVSNIDKNKTQFQVKGELSKYLCGVKSVKLQDTNTILDINETINAFVTFETHQFAAAARRLLVPGSIQLWGFTLTADWAKARDFQTLFIRLSNSNVDAETLRQFFSFCNLKVLKVNIKNDIAFVKFSSFREANFVNKYFSQIQLPYFVNEYLNILEVSWPKRK